ncbi:tail fiber domain-containing protein, partial [Corallococcus sp. CA053C]|uniref:tail fiber domain-containing protein n=1 Tax=Corallococcus sp. CA053C TaxID=2316732 RepID=UPI000EC04274
QSLERTYYYQGELLQLADFIRDQRYTRDLVGYQNRQLFAPGVLQGLALSGLGGTSLIVAPGMAFSGAGVPLYVVRNTNMTAQGQTPDGSYLAVLDYADNNTPEFQASLKSTHAIIENPKLTLAPVGPTAPGNGIILGIVAFKSGKVDSIDQTATSGRQTSWLLLPTSSSSVAPTSFRGALRVEPDSTGADTMLQITQDLAGRGAGASTARFDFTDGDVKDSGVSINTKKADGSHALLSARYGGSDVWELAQDGTPRTLSDASLKVDVRPLTGALERVAALRPVSFAWRADPSGPRRLGLLAQETAQVLPEVVGTNAQGQAMIAYQELVPLLLQSVRELTERVAGLEQRLAARVEER